jgi:hypothetical protein
MSHPIDISISHSKALSKYNFRGTKYGVQERVGAVVAFMIHGSIRRTAEAVNLPASTLRDWKNQEWWADLYAEVRAEKESEFQAGFSRIVQAAIGEIEDRLTHGDVRLVKTRDGYEQRRVPISAKDAVMVSAIAYDKLRLSLNLPTTISSSQKSLTELSEEFRNIAKNYRRDVIDIKAS